MAESNVNGGRVTLRDVMALQKEMYEEISEVRKEISNVKVKVALISGSVSVIITIVLHLVRAGISG